MSEKFFSSNFIICDFKFSNLGILMSLFGNQNVKGFNLFRTLRSLRPLKVLSRFEEIRVTYKIYKILFEKKSI